MPVTPIYRIQGDGLAPGQNGERLTTSGVVTAVLRDGFYLQDPAGDGDAKTSDGIFVFTGQPPAVQVGDEARVTGTVVEFIPPNSAARSVTRLAENPLIEVTGHAKPLPAPVLIGKKGRRPPTQNVADAIAFYESLEGMRVRVAKPKSVSPTNAYGDVVVLADRGRGATGRNRRGGMLERPTDANPERIPLRIDRTLLPDFKPRLNVGDTLGDVVGIMRYQHGSYQVVATEPFTTSKAGLQPETTSLVGTAKALTIASFNVENLDGKVEDPQRSAKQVDDDVASGKVARLAAQIADNLRSPDIVTLVEMQDNDGAEQSNVVDGRETFRLLIDAIVAAGGPRYEFIERDPERGQDGGQPGGNIRVGFLYRPERVEPVPESVARVGEGNPAFNGGRKSLAAKFRFNGEEVLVVANHFAARLGSTPLFGSVQPPVVGAEEMRRKQAEVVRDYLAAAQTANPAAKIVVCGDYNDTADSVAMRTLRGKTLVNLTSALKASDRYTFNFSGNSMAIDHILVSRNLAGKVEYDVVHVNSEFTDQASDHDPVVARIKVGN